uniref:VWFA domain-containing protein n=1 Tax=Strongyloides papillosus TaxID=174720 RepID=A0A0N5CFY9_STREA
MVSWLPKSWNFQSVDDLWQFCPNRQNFVGDFFFQSGRKLQIAPQTLGNVFVEVLEKRVTNRKDCNEPPKRIIVLLDGLTDAQFRDAIHGEIGGLRAACERFQSG